ncbi:hypothetical protein HK101_008075 [Irineochytrium annulatum]|nr:hypothetical protein HK101_008075 [Irineochytrium annulatum]
MTRSDSTKQSMAAPAPVPAASSPVSWLIQSMPFFNTTAKTGPGATSKLGVAIPARLASLPRNDSNPNLHQIKDLLTPLSSRASPTREGKDYQTAHERQTAKFAPGRDNASTAGKPPGVGRTGIMARSPGSNSPTGSASSATSSSSKMRDEHEPPSPVWTWTEMCASVPIIPPAGRESFTLAPPSSGPGATPASSPVKPVVQQQQQQSAVRNRKAVVSPLAPGKLTYAQVTAKGLKASTTPKGKAGSPAQRALERLTGSPVRSQMQARGVVAAVIIPVTLVMVAAVGVIAMLMMSEAVRGRVWESVLGRI